MKNIEKWIVICVLQGKAIALMDEENDIRIWKSKEAIKKHAGKSSLMMASDVVMVNIETGETDTL